MFSDINYQTARQEDQDNMFLMYCNLINFFDSSIDIQITINNKRKNKVEFENNIIIPLKHDGLDEFRNEYNLMQKRAGTEGKNDSEKQKYITMTIQANSFEDARNKFFRLENEVTTSLKRLGSTVNVLDTRERLPILHDFFRQGHEGQFTFRKENKNTQTSYKDLISPDSFEFKKDHFMIGDKYARVLYLRELPTFMNDQIISELTDFSFNMMLSIHIKPIDQGKALKIINNQIRGMETDKIKYQKRSTKSGYFDAFIPMELKYASEEAQELLDDLMNRNQKMFFVNVTIMHIADTKEQLDEESQEILNIGTKYLLQIGKLSFQQENAMATCLPIGYKKLEIDNV